MRPSLHGGCRVQAARYRRSLAHTAPQAMAPGPKNRPRGAKGRPIPGPRPTPGLPQAVGKNGSQEARLPCAPLGAASLRPSPKWPVPATPTATAPCPPQQSPLARVPACQSRACQSRACQSRACQSRACQSRACQSRACQARRGRQGLGRGLRPKAGGARTLKKGRSGGAAAAPPCCPPTRRVAAPRISDAGLAPGPGPNRPIGGIPAGRR